MSRASAVILLLAKLFVACKAQEQRLNERLSFLPAALAAGRLGFHARPGVASSDARRFIAVFPGAPLV